MTITTGLKNENELSYSIFYRGSPIIASSPLGLEFENEKPLSRDLTVVSDKEKMVKENWKPVYGEKDNYLNHYKEVTIQFKERKTPYRLFSLTMLEKNGQAMVIRPIK